MTTLNAIPTKPPDRESRHAKIWKVPPKTAGPKDWEASIGAAIVSFPFAHPIWTRWFVGCISLADLPGIGPAKKRFPTATHEILFFAFDPKLPAEELDAGLEPGTTNSLSKAFLEPADLVHQIELQSDAQAAAIFETILDAIEQGGVPPDSDFRRWWTVSLDATAKHYREGGHPEAAQ